MWKEKNSFNYIRILELIVNYIIKYITKDHDTYQDDYIIILFDLLVSVPSSIQTYLCNYVTCIKNSFGFVEYCDKIFKFLPKFKNLKVLELCYDCKLDFFKKVEVPLFLFNMKNLTILDLQSNNISYLPEDINLLINLKELNLWDNFNLRKIPDSINELTNLEILDLPWNKIEQLYLSLPNLIGLGLCKTKYSNLTLNCPQLVVVSIPCIWNQGEINQFLSIHKISELVVVRENCLENMLIDIFKIIKKFSNITISYRFYDEEWFFLEEVRMLHINFGLKLNIINDCEFFYYCEKVLQGTREPFYCPFASCNCHVDVEEFNS